MPLGPFIVAGITKLFANMFTAVIFLYQFVHNHVSKYSISHT